MFSILPLFTGSERIFIKSRSWLFFIILVAMFAFSIVLIIFCIFPEQVANMEARYHIWRNHYEIKIYGVPFEDGYYAAMLQKHGVSYVSVGGSFVRVGGCMVHKPMIDYVEHYNSIMREAIWRNLGVRVEK